jgi:hypothetical protein
MSFAQSMVDYVSTKPSKKRGFFIGEFDAQYFTELVPLETAW